MATDKAVNLKLMEATEKFAAALAEINEKLDKALASLGTQSSKLETASKAVERKTGSK